MSRSAVWQRNVSDAVSWHQDQALNSTIFILREIGPTSFLLKEEGESKKFKVCLGDPHICNCANFRKEKSLCKHICWLLLKKFKLERQNELSYQLGLVEREINGLLKGPTRTPTGQIHETKATERKDEGNCLEQRPIAKDDVCPICQDQLLANHLPVTYCRYGCGNSVHIKCMKVWADHQHQSTGSNNIQCPFCRNDFGTLSHLLKEYRNSYSEQNRLKKPNDHLDSHTNITCNVCRMSPIKGKCYKCTTCNDYHLCNACYHANNHQHHSFVFRVKKVQRWRPTPPRNDVGAAGDLVIDTVASDLQMREITENDYETLLELDRPRNSNGIPVDLAGLPDHVINRLPMIKVRHGGKLLAPGRQCRLCLRAYVVGQLVRQLPDCGHSFHRDCIDKWLREDHRCCPIDREPVREPTSATTNHNTASDNPGSREASGAGAQSSDLVVPGIGLVRFSTSPNTSNRSAANSIQSAPVRRRPRRIFDGRRAAADHVISGDITLGDILIQADAIGTSANTKPRGSSDLDVMHIRDTTGAPNSAPDPLAMLNGAQVTSQPRRKEPVKERKTNSRKPTRKVRTRPANGGAELPLFPRNREESFELSGISIAKPAEEDAEGTPPFQTSPGIYASPVHLPSRQYRHSYMPDVPSTTPEPVIHHQSPVLHVNIVHDGLSSDGESVETETKRVLAGSSVRNGDQRKCGVAKGLAAGWAGAVYRREGHSGDARVLARPRLSPEFVVCHSAPTAARKRSSHDS